MINSDLYHCMWTGSNAQECYESCESCLLYTSKSTYDDYEQGAKEKLEDVDVQLKTIKKSGIVPAVSYTHLDVYKRQI